MQLKLYPIKTYLIKEHYQRITDEAIARKSNKSKVISDCLKEYFALRGELATAIEAPGKLGEEHSGKVVHTLLARTEERIGSILMGIQEKIQILDAEQKILIKMIEHFYLDIMQYFEEPPADLKNKSTEIARKRYQAWVAKTRK